MSVGTGKVSGPCDTTIVTGLPYGVISASGGSTEITSPRSMSLEYAACTTGANPAARSAFSAPVWVLPTTAGTATGAWPLLIHRSTAEPCGRLAVGRVLPDDVPLGDRVVVDLLDRADREPGVPSALVAASCVSR